MSYGPETGDLFVEVLATTPSPDAEAPSLPPIGIVPNSYVFV